jgi:feruloyl esterase
MIAPHRSSKFLVPALALFTAAIPALGASCESLASLSSPQMTVTSARLVAAGASSRTGLPAYCQVAATLKPSSDSDIKIEVWLPASDWNGKYQAVGNGGWAGSISYDAMAQALAHGYATSSTDTGHSGGGASFALGHPEKVIDYAYRSEHEMVVSAKAIIAAFYGRAPRLSYWNSCSSGGKQALKEAQRFPEDFDGIIAGSPANNWTGRAAHSLWVGQAVHRDEASYIPPAKYQLIHNAVLQACDARDGVKDGLIEDPTRCKFDPQVLECKGTDTSACLTPSQVEAARKIYAPVVNPRTKQEIFPGLEPGSELGWNVMAGPQVFGIGNDYFKYVVFKNPSWDYRTFNFDQDMDFTEKVDNGTINATDPNLKPFFKHGGKLLQYHGWNDWQIAPLNSVHYYQSVQNAVGAAEVQGSYKLFMAPGMGHCGGGEGPNKFDMLSALEQWVEHGQAPKQVIASRSADGVDRSRPLCPYPQVAKYKGSGSIDDAANFTCAAPDPNTSTK